MNETEIAIQHPVRPGARGSIIEVGPQDFLHRPVLDAIPADGTVIRVVTVQNRTERQQFAPPVVVGIDYVDTPNIEWRIVPCPWNFRRTSAYGQPAVYAPIPANHYNLDRFQWTIRAQGFDPETGAEINRTIDIDIDCVRGAETGTPFESAA